MKVNIYELAPIVSEYFDLTPEEMFKKTRVTEIVEARMCYFYLARHYGSKSLSFIGGVSLRYGRTIKFDHATVLHSINKIKGLCEVYPETQKQINDLKDLIDIELLKIGLLENLVPIEVNLLQICKNQELKKVA